MAFIISDTSCNPSNSLTQDEQKRGIAAVELYFRWLHSAKEIRDVWNHKNGHFDKRVAGNAARQRSARRIWAEAETVALCAAFSNHNDVPENATLIWYG